MSDIFLTIRFELENSNFDTTIERDKSYQYVYTKCNELKNQKLKNDLIDILDDIIKFPTLQQAYFAMLDYLLGDI